MSNEQWILLESERQTKQPITIIDGDVEGDNEQYKTK